MFLFYCNYNSIMYIIKESEKISFIDFIRKNNLEGEFDSFHDLWIRWHNNNNEKVIDKLIKNEKYILLSKALFYVKEILNTRSLGTKVLDEDFITKVLNTKIDLYRGGGGIYDPSYSKIKRNWVSFTFSEKRLNTFSKYFGTTTSSSYSLDTNNSYWQVKLTIPLNDILLYYEVGDHEVIVPIDIAKKAKLIKQT